MTTRSLILAFFLSWIAACSPEISETGRYANPTDSVDAVTAIREVGATVATPTEIYVTAKDTSVSGDPVFRADHVDGLNVSWIDGKTLLIKAEQARVFVRKNTTCISGKCFKVIFEISNEISIK